MKRKQWFPPVIVLALLLSGCVASPASLDDARESTIRFEYPAIRAVEAMERLSDGSSLARLDLTVGSKNFSCYGKFSSDVLKKLSEKKRLHKLRLKRTETGLLVVESFQTSMGVYGGLQYWAAHSWLSTFLPYAVAHTISLIVPAVVFLLIVALGAVFVEF